MASCFSCQAEGPRFESASGTFHSFPSGRGLYQPWAILEHFSAHRSRQAARGLQASLHSCHKTISRMILKHQQKTLNHQALMPIKGPEPPCLQVGTVRTKVGQTMW